MNTELKAMLAAVLSLVKGAKDLAEKAGPVAELADMEALLASLPAVVSNWSDISAEIKALPGSAQEADLIAFIASQVAGLDSNAKVQAILSASLQLVSNVAVDVVSLVNAIKA